ncbi:MAG: glycosyltransferase family 39 protein, partial [Patescibacteria group bacterium]
MANIKKIISHHRAITIVLTLGFLASIAYSFYFQVNVTVDARAYDSIAISLVRGTGYTEITRPDLPDAAIGRLGPGYEFFLAGIYWVFGHQVWIVWIIQSLLHTFSALFVYFFVRRFLKEPEWPAVLGAGVYIFFIDLLEFPAMLLTETLYLFLVLAALTCAFNYVERERIGDVAGAAALFTLALLVRPPITIAMMVFLGFVVFRRQYRHAIIFSAVALVFLTPWTVRNYIRYQRVIVTSAIIVYDVWVGNSPESRHIGELVATDEIDRYSEEEGLFAANERGTREVLSFALKHPGDFISLQFTKTSIYFSAARPAAFWFHLR